MVATIFYTYQSNLALVHVKMHQELVSWSVFGVVLTVAKPAVKLQESIRCAKHTNSDQRVVGETD